MQYSVCVDHLTKKRVYTEICESDALRSQDPQTAKRQWRASASLHVYKNRPSSSPSTIADPHNGLKVFQYQDIGSPGCGLISAAAMCQCKDHVDNHH